MSIPVSFNRGMSVMIKAGTRGAVAMIAAIGSQRPPTERGVDAPAAEFSSQRAFEHVLAIASKPRPAGSPEIVEARKYLVRTIDSMGFCPVIQQGRLTQPNAGTLELANVAARIKGSSPPGQKAVLLMAHFDSGPNAPGASDDGSGVATLLETLQVPQRRLPGQG
jgi:Zn-dependent M28 family amino/carboxypeptidase